MAGVRPPGNPPPGRDNQPDKNSNKGRPSSRRTPYNPPPPQQRPASRNSSSRPSDPASSRRPGPPRPQGFFDDQPASPSDTFRPRAPRVKTKRASNGRRWWLLGYVALSVFIVVGLVGLFFVSRAVNLFNGVSVERVDTQGNAIKGSDVTGSGKVNILLLGVDERVGDTEDGTRSDTMIIVSVDQGNKTASMLSIPRDLYVDIPGHGKNRINSSYFFGDRDRPGVGGPPLAKETVEKNFGIKINYFAQVNFSGFQQVVDAIGGVTIDVKKPLIDNEFPTEDFGYKRVYIPAGVQHMNGKTALEYARSRHADSDLGRNQRQQEVLLAVREQGINIGILTNSDLVAALQKAVKTDLQLGDVISLAQTANGLNKDNIRTFSIDANMTQSRVIDIGDVLIPDWNAIAALVQKFNDTRAAAAPAATTKETASISVLNGTFIEGRAAATQTFLKGKGYTVGTIGQASDAGQYPKTVIRVYNNKQATARELASLLKVPEANIQNKGSGPTDIEIICGEELSLPST